MARGPSGRLVVEIEPDLKRQLYGALSIDGLTFKDWLTMEASRYISSRNQLQLLVTEPLPPAYAGRSKEK